MVYGRPKAVFAAALSLLVLLSSTADAFLPPNVPSRSVSFTQVNMFDFLKEGKKKLVKSLAGEYDQAAVKARIDGYINNNKVLMFSFTT
mmetsp:Transcript_33234/g.49528  ORF Transcript_33234/g.49528 Transcript_33234/m.49528 type:complete len:89 (+) Transcript_33234:46-312(+)